MTFSDDLERLRAGQQRSDRAARAADDARRSAYDSALEAARLAFIEKANEATTLLREKGAPARRVVSIHWGMHGAYQINSAHSYSVIAIGDMAVHNGDLIFGRAMTAGVRSIWHRLRKGSLVFNTDDEYANPRLTLEYRNGGVTGELCIATTDWDGRGQASDAYAVLLEATASELQRLEGAHR